MFESCVSRHLVFQVGHANERDTVVFVVIGEESDIVIGISQAS
jgi:hypothetical protein